MYLALLASFEAAGRDVVPHFAKQAEYKRLLYPNATETEKKPRRRRKRFVCIEEDAWDELPPEPKPAVRRRNHTKKMPVLALADRSVPVFGCDDEEEAEAETRAKGSSTSSADSDAASSSTSTSSSSGRGRVSGSETVVAVAAEVEASPATPVSPVTPAGPAAQMKPRGGGGGYKRNHMPACHLAYTASLHASLVAMSAMWLASRRLAKSHGIGMWVRQNVRRALQPRKSVVL